MRVLIVEDEREVADIIQRAVRSASWAPTVMETGKDALTALVSEEYDLLVLDVGLPDLDGFEVCSPGPRPGEPHARATPDRAERLARQGHRSRCGRGRLPPQTVRCRRAACSSPRAGAAARHSSRCHTSSGRSRARRRHPHGSTRGPRAPRLTAREYALVEYLLRNPRRVVSRSQVLEHVWDDNFDPVGNAVDVLVSRVRRKVDAGNGPTLVHTVRNVGYVLTDRNAPDAA